MDIYKRLSSTEAMSWDLFCNYVVHNRKTKRDLKNIVNRKSRSKLKKLDRKVIYGLYEKENG